MIEYGPIDDGLPEEAEENECRGKYIERLATPHSNPAAVAHHLRVFLGFWKPESFVAYYGVDVVNEALAQLSASEGVKNPCGLLSWLAKEAAAGNGNKERKPKGFKRSQR